MPDILIAVGAGLLILLAMLARQPRRARPAPKNAAERADPASTWMDGGSSSSLTNDRPAGDSSADSDCASDGDGSAGGDGGGSCDGGGGDGGGGSGGGD